MVTAGTSVIDVIIGDHQEVFRIGIAEVLGAADDIRILGKPECRKQLLATLTTINPHVLILSTKFLSAFPKIMRMLTLRRPALLVLTEEDDPVAYLRSSGAQGVIDRSMNGPDMVDAVRHVARIESLAQGPTLDALENPPNLPAV